MHGPVVIPEVLVWGVSATAIVPAAPEVVNWVAALVLNSPIVPDTTPFGYAFLVNEVWTQELEKFIAHNST